MQMYRYMPKSYFLMFFAVQLSCYSEGYFFGLIYFLQTVSLKDMFKNVHVYILFRFNKITAHFFYFNVHEITFSKNFHCNSDLVVMPFGNNLLRWGFVEHTETDSPAKLTVNYLPIVPFSLPFQ